MTRWTNSLLAGWSLDRTERSALLVCPEGLGSMTGAAGIEGVWNIFFGCWIAPGTWMAPDVWIKPPVCVGGAAGNFSARNCELGSGATGASAIGACAIALGVKPPRVTSKASGRAQETRRVIYENILVLSSNSVRGDRRSAGET